MKVYVSGKFEQKNPIRNVMKVIKDYGATITHDWTEYDEPKTFDEARLNSKNDMYGIQAADALLVVAYHDLPYKNTLIEIGIALGLKIPVYILGDSLDNLMFISLCTKIKLNDFVAFICRE